MMAERRSIHKIGVVLTLILFFAITIVITAIENNAIMGVQIIRNSEYEKMSESQDDFDINILFNDIPAPVDKNTKTIYISQKIDENTRYKDFKGTLSADNPEYSFLFVDDEKLDNLQQAAKDNHSYTLLAVNPEGCYKKYNLIFTTLPLLNISGDYVGQHDPWREKYEGQICFFDPDSEEYNDYRTVTTDASWHKRGNTISRQPKLSWKITLLKPNGENKNESFCGLGEDDDWILNAMSLDDLKIREKIMIDLWNKNKVFTDNKASMSRGEYTEVILDGEYKGLYLLQRRVDGKYLGLEEDDILIKGNTYYPTEITADYFEIKYPTYSEQAVRDFLNEKFVSDITYGLNTDNLIDTNLFINMVCAPDNFSEKNIYRLFSNTDGDYDIKLILWDTDMAFGLKWQEGVGFVYNFDEMVYTIVYRKETSTMFEKKPELEKLHARRWFELRQTLFSDENIAETIGSIYESITESGSLQREYASWELKYDGADTMDKLYTFIDMRLEYLDQYYASFL